MEYVGTPETRSNPLGRRQRMVSALKDRCSMMQWLISRSIGSCSIFHCRAAPKRKQEPVYLSRHTLFIFVCNCETQRTFGGKSCSLVCQNLWTHPEFIRILRWRKHKALKEAGRVWSSSQLILCCVENNRYR